VPGHARVEEGPHQRRAGGRRVLRPLQDDGAAGAERRGNFAHRLVDREGPGREAGDRPHGLAQDELHYALAAGGDHPSVGAPPLLREPFDDLGGDMRLDAGFVQRLALLQGHQPGDVGVALAQQRGRLAHDLGTVVRGNA
ncbi:hypothetical protein QU40_00225, partial [Staphylococcus aureus]